MLLVISDGVSARVGSLSADRECFQRWRTIDSDQQLDPLGQHRDLERVERGVFDPRRFLDFLHFFCLFEDDGRIIKKTAAYHQFHAARANSDTTRGPLYPYRPHHWQARLEAPCAADP